MSGDHYRGGAEPEEENGMGWGGLVPTAAERREEQAEEKRRAQFTAVCAQRDALLVELRHTTFLLTSACLVIRDAAARKTALAAVKRAEAAIAKATGQQGGAA